MYLHLRLWAVLTLLMTHLAVVTNLGAIPVGVAGSPRELVERTTEELRTAVIREQEAINHYQLEVGSMVIWLEAGSQAKATSPTECG